MKKKVLSLFFFLSVYNGFSQCCSPGNPVGGDVNQGVMNKNSLRTILFFKNSVSNDYYEGDKKSTGPSYIDKGTFNFSGVTLAYGLLKKLTIESELGYFINKKQELDTKFGRQELEGSGLSDLSFIGKFKIFSNPDNQLEITTGAGYKISVGEYQQRNEYGVLLPIDIQPSTGASGYIGSLFLYKGFIEKKLRFFFTSRAQITSSEVVFTEIIPTKYYKFGNFFNNSIFASYSLTPRWSLILQARHEYRTQDQYKDQNHDYKIYASSGGQKLIAVPQLVFEIRQGFIASALFDIPLYQYYNEKQLATAYAGSIAVSKVFGFQRPEKKIENPKAEK